MKVAFILGEFPVISETFIINQIADLVDRGVDIRIYSFRKSDTTHVSERYRTYNLAGRTRYLDVPKNTIVRALKTAYLFLVFLIRNPGALLRALNVKKYGIQARSLRTLFWTAPFLGEHFDIVHCHFGPVANQYLAIRDILKRTEPLITTFYGNDVSHIPKEKGMGYYRALEKACVQFFVQSENMKTRVIPLGIPPERITVLPLSIDVSSYPYAPRALTEGERVRIVSVGRFVEKKGFEDVLKAVAVVKEKTKKPFVVDIVGDGPLKENLHNLAAELGVTDVVTFKGYMKLQDVLKLYTKAHLYVQASKTASDGDME